MKKVIFLITSFFSIVFSQNWTPVKATNINLLSAYSVDIFTNGYGNHIIVQYENQLLYYRMDVNGNATNPIIIENSSVISPSITGNSNKIFIVFRKNNENFIRIKTSDDGGINWYYLEESPLNSNASSIESVMSNDILHLTYGVSNQVYHTQYNYEYWTIPYSVSNQSLPAYNPRINAWNYNGENKVFFSLSSCTDTCSLEDV